LRRSGADVWPLLAIWATTEGADSEPLKLVIGA